MSDWRIAGHCPMGCGETLMADLDGQVYCTMNNCPDPLATHKLLRRAGEIEHILYSDNDDGWILIHPLRERVSDTLDCGLGLWLRRRGGPPVKAGRYRVMRAGDQEWSFISLEG